MAAVIAEILERRTLLAAAPGPLVPAGFFGTVDGQAVVARVAGAPGVRLSVALSGPGAGTAVANGDRVDLTLDGTTAESVVTVKSWRGGRARLGNVVVRGPLGALVAAPAEWVGDVVVEGSLGQLNLGTALKPVSAAPGQRTIRLAPGAATVVRLGAVRDVSIDAPGVSFASISAAGWDDEESNGRDVIVAETITSLNVGTGAARAAKGKRARNGGAGVFDADLVATSVGTVGVAGHATLDATVVHLGALVVGGDLVQSRVTAMGGAGQDASVGDVVVRGAIQGLRLVTLGDVGSVTAGAIHNSEIMAGVRYGFGADGTIEQVLPNKSHSDDFDFTGTYSIGAVTVSGAGREARAFTNTRIAAYRIGDVRLEGVAATNMMGRPFGVAAHTVGTVLRRFAGADAGKNHESNPVTDLVIRQTSAPLTFVPVAGGYGGYVGLVDNAGAVFLSSGGYGMSWGPTVPELPYVSVPAEGVSVARVRGHPLAAAIYLTVAGTYEARTMAGTVVSTHASLADAVVEVAGAPGTALKVVHVPATATVAGSMRFLSTSAGPSATVALPAKPLPFHTGYVAGQELLAAAPTLADLTAGVLARTGVAPVVLDREPALVTAGGVEVGKTVDDTGVRTIRMTEDGRFRVVDAGGSVVWEGAELVGALAGTGPRIGLRRLPVRVVGKGEVQIHGLARGGSAVFKWGGRMALDTLGNLTPLADGAGIVAGLRAAGVDVAGYDV